MYSSARVLPVRDARRTYRPGLSPWSAIDPVQPRALIRPRSTAEVSTALRLCHAAGQSVVPQGGLTGLAGGATPRHGDIVLSLERSMKCGVGTCGHCQLGPDLICRDGPCTTYAHAAPLLAVKEL